MNVITYIFMATVLLTTIVSAIMYYSSRDREHKKRKDEYISVVKNKLSDGPLLKFFIHYINRHCDYILSYFKFQSIGKACDGLGIFFSIATLAIVTTQTKVSIFPTIISILAITFVIISVCVNPVKRARQYLVAWRNCDRNILMLMATINSLTEEEVMEFAQKCASDMADVEESLTTDEE